MILQNRTTGEIRVRFCDTKAHQAVPSPLHVETRTCHMHTLKIPAGTSLDSSVLGTGSEYLENKARAAGLAE